VVLLKISSVRGNSLGLYVGGLIGEGLELLRIQRLGINAILDEKLLC
jgi:hypothetical protein